MSRAAALSSLCLLLSACGTQALRREDPLWRSWVVMDAAMHAHRNYPRELEESDRLFDCAAMPELCKPPFNCHMKGQEKFTGATRDGHANWHAWCASPNYAMAALHCQKGQLRMYGQAMHAAQNATDPLIQYMDSHYCFANGHCDNEDIRPNTTIEEAEAMCDDKFGHTNWTSITKVRTTILDARISIGGPYFSEKAERKLAMMACAMGNYHCDIFYCQQELCRGKEWRNRSDPTRPKEMRKKHGKRYPPHNW